MDVYQWHEGALSLISTGDSPRYTEFTGAGADGKDVFIASREALVGFDDPVYRDRDIYDARIEGGFPEPPARAPPCEGEACRGAAPAARPATGAGSAAFRGPGNRRAKPNNCARFARKAKRKSALAKRAARKGQAKRSRALRRQARELSRRAKRCDRRRAS
jgi:hypothetical protein